MQLGRESPSFAVELSLIPGDGGKKKGKLLLLLGRRNIPDARKRGKRQSRRKRKKLSMRRSVSAFVIVAESKQGEFSVRTKFTSDYKFERVVSADGEEREELRLAMMKIN